MKGFYAFSFFCISSLGFAADPVVGNYTLSAFADGTAAVVLKGPAAEALYKSLKSKDDFIETADIRANYRRGKNFSCFDVYEPTQGVECVLQIDDTATGKVSQR